MCTWIGCEFAWVQRSSSVCVSGCYLYKSRAINKSASFVIDHRETGASDKKEPWIYVSCIISYCYWWGCVALVTTSVLCSRWPVPAGEKSHIFSLVISGLLFMEFGSLNGGAYAIHKPSNSLLISWKTLQGTVHRIHSDSSSCIFKVSPGIKSPAACESTE